MMNKIKNYGLNVEETLAGLDSTHYLLGSTSKLGTEIILPDHNWRPYVPKYEPQFFGNFDTYGCTVFGSYNAIETLMKQKYGKDYNFAERFTYILAGIRPPGGDPHKVGDVIRRKGLVAQEKLPITLTFDEFITPDPMTKELIDEGEKFLSEFEIAHEWVFTNTPNTADRISMLKWALQRGTVCISVTAWYQDADGLYIDGGQQNTHWTQLVDIEEKDGKFYPIVADSYDLILNGESTSFIKKLHPEHKITMAKRYSVTSKPKSNELTPQQRNRFLEILRDMLVAIGILQKRVDEIKKQEEVKPAPAPVPAPVEPVVTTPFPVKKSQLLYDKSKSLIGKHLTLDDSVPKDVGCAQAISYVLKEAGYPIPKGGISGTASMADWLKNNCDEVFLPEKGDIIISISFTGVPNFRGHVGVVGVSQIMSNNSDTGLWDTQWTYQGWIDYYQKKGRLKTKYFRVRE